MSRTQDAALAANVAFAGLTAAGKTTHAQRLAADLGPGRTRRPRSRPPYVRGSPDTAAPAGTRRHATAQTRNSPLAKEIQLADPPPSCWRLWRLGHTRQALDNAGFPGSGWRPPLRDVDKARLYQLPSAEHSLYLGCVPEYRLGLVLAFVAAQNV